MSWFSRFLPQRSLDEIPPEGAHVDVEVVVASPNRLTSPIAPTIAAAIQWTLLEGPQDSRQHSALLPLATGWRGTPLLVRSSTKTVEIPLSGARFHARYVDVEDGVAVHGPAAEVYGEAIARLETRCMMYLRELPLVHGQRLRLKAFVVPLRTKSGDYRTVPVEESADLRATRAVHLYD
jgi:hypothetical protein